MLNLPGKTSCKRLARRDLQKINEHVAATQGLCSLTALVTAIRRKKGSLSSVIHRIQIILIFLKIPF